MRRLSNLALVLTFSLVISGCDNDSDKPDVIRGVWMVQTLKSDNVDSVPEAGDTLLLNFEDEDSYDLRLTRNLCFGSYSIDNSGDISFDLPACTKAGGDSEASFVFRTVLRSVDKFLLEEDQLTISGPDEEVELQRMN